MTDIRELYQETIIDHGRQPRNFGTLPEANLHHEGFNPLCGDKIVLHIHEENNNIKNIKFEGSGCAISMASASLMTEMLRNKSLQDIEKIFNEFHKLVLGQSADENILGKLAIFAGVAEYPARVKCATLAWHALKTIFPLYNKQEER